MEIQADKTNKPLLRLRRAFLLIGEKIGFSKTMTNWLISLKHSSLDNRMLWHDFRELDTAEDLARCEQLHESAALSSVVSDAPI